MLEIIPFLLPSIPSKGEQEQSKDKPKERKQENIRAIYFNGYNRQIQGVHDTEDNLKSILLLDCSRIKRAGTPPSETPSDQERLLENLTSKVDCRLQQNNKATGEPSGQKSEDP